MCREGGSINSSCAANGLADNDKKMMAKQKKNLFILLDIIGGSAAQVAPA